MMRFINRFTPAESNKLALAYTYFFLTQMAPMSLLEILFMDHLVKEGHSLQFITTIFKTFLQEPSTTIDQLTSMLKKNGLDDKVLIYGNLFFLSFLSFFLFSSLILIFTIYKSKNKSKKYSF